MCTPYERRDDWCVLATRFKDNIYLCEKETDKKRQARLIENEIQKRVFSYGFKFEQFCLSPNPSEEPSTKNPVDECDEFYCMYKTKLQGMGLLYGAQVDGVISSVPYQNLESKEVLNTLKFVELKCSIRPTNERQQQNFYKFKCKNWWCQSFLVGIQDLMVGYRNDRGHVNEIKHMEVQSLPRLSANYWTVSQCLDFLKKFLQMVKHTIKNVDCPNTVYKFYFDPRSREITYQIYTGKSQFTFLPDWYVTMIQQRSEADLQKTS